MKASITTTEPPPRAARGYTLVELLVVITIVAVLASLVFMGVQRGMDAAHNAECVSNLRRLATAGQIYASEHGAYPNSGRQMDGSRTWWFQAMEVELGFESGTSPAIIERADTMPTCKKCLKSHPRGKPHNNFVRTYSMNQRLRNPARNSEGQWGFPGLRESAVTSPSRTAFFMDGSVAGSAHYWYYVIRIDQWVKEENFIHNGKANVVFLDGHVEAFRLEDIPTNRSHPFWDPRATDLNAPKQQTIRNQPI